MALDVESGGQGIAAAGGAQAIDPAREPRPDAVLLDLMMPVVDGRATFQALRADERTRDIPVILLTAKLQGGQCQAWDDMAVAGVISKPFSPMTLGTEVAAMLGWGDATG